MAKHRERKLLRCDASAIVDYFHQVDAAAFETHTDARGAGIDGVLDELLHNRRGALDDLACGYLTDRDGIEEMNYGHARGRSLRRVRFASYSGPVGRANQMRPFHVGG